MSGVLCAVCCVCVVFNMKEKHVNAALKSNQVTHGGWSRSHGAFWDQNLHFISISNISTPRYFMSHNLSPQTFDSRMLGIPERPRVKYEISRCCVGL